ncbi:MAG: sulfotransferase domain-containing protein [Rhodospirillales bacterium]|nr:sulfotransferase domain-containing protein [Rhodospirillales bacterium]
MRFLPEVFVIGAQKAGTTSLAYFLDQHPQVALSNPKEPHFLTSNWQRGLKWYEDCYRGAGDRVLVDASTTYAMAPIWQGPYDNPPWGQEVPARLAALQPNARLIYMLRNPVDRVWSSYWHSVRTGIEHQTFGRAIQTNRLYVAVSCYYAQIELWLRHVPLDRIHFIDFRRFAKDPQGVTAECIRFLDLPSFEPAPDRPRNQSYQYNALGRVMRDLAGGEHALKTLVAPIRMLVPDSVRLLARRMLSSPIPEMPEIEREKLKTEFAEDNARLKALTGIDFG